MNLSKIAFIKIGLKSKEERTIYKYVRKVTYSDGRISYQYTMKNPKIEGTCDDIRQAAIAIDKHLIKHGKEPINILKRKP